MWGVCGWSALLVMCVFTPCVHTIGGVNIGVNSMVATTIHVSAAPLGTVRTTWGHVPT